MTKDHRKRALPFIAAGAAFMLIGSTGPRVLILVGVVFWVIGLSMLRPPRE